jgi:hypothetical protein
VWTRQHPRRKPLATRPTIDSASGNALQMGFQGMAGQKNDCGNQEQRPAAEATGRDGIILPPGPVIPRQVAPQQSLLVFHRTAKSALRPKECRMKSKTRQTRLPGRRHSRSTRNPSGQRRIPLKTGHSEHKIGSQPQLLGTLLQSVHLLVLTRPSVAGFNAPPDSGRFVLSTWDSPLISADGADLCPM